MCTVVVISAVGLNSGNFNITLHFPWVEKFPAAVANTVFSVTDFFRCLTVVCLIIVELAPESYSAFKVTYLSFSLLLFNSMKLIGTNFVGSMRCFLCLFKWPLR